MKIRKLAGLALFVPLALATSACQPDIAPVEANSLDSTARLVEVGEEESDGVESSRARGRSEVATSSLDEDLYGSFGLLAPTVPGFSLGTYASACDPFEDSLGSCL